MTMTCSLLLSQTPRKFLLAEKSIYKQLAVPWYPSKEHRTVSVLKVMQGWEPGGAGLLPAAHLLAAHR